MIVAIPARDGRVGGGGAGEGGEKEQEEGLKGSRSRVREESGLGGRCGTPCRSVY